METRGIVLDLLHAHRVSPKLLCNKRLNLFAIRIYSVPSVRKSAEPIIVFSSKLILTIIKDITSMSFIMVETRGIEPLSKTDLDKLLRV